MVDVHARRLLVRPGQRVRPGQVVARSGRLAAPDGCHLHFEKRPRGAGYLSAVDPERSLRRTVVSKSPPQTCRLSSGLR